MGQHNQQQIFSEWAKPSPAGSSLTALRRAASRVRQVLTQAPWCRASSRRPARMPQAARRSASSASAAARLRRSVGTSAAAAASLPCCRGTSAAAVCRAVGSPGTAAESSLCVAAWRSWNSAGNAETAARRADCLCTSCKKPGCVHM